MKRQLLAGLALSVLTCSTPALAVSGQVGDDLRAGLRLTFYGNGMALIDDHRKVVLEKGINTLNVLGISPGMIDDSTRIDSDGKFLIGEQSYLPDNLSYQDLLKAYVGKQVKVIRTHPQTGEETTLDADLISVRQGIILRIGGQIETALPGRIVFPDIPPGLRANPVYRVTGTAMSAGKTDIGLSYLSNGFSWNAHHTLELDGRKPSANLESRAALVNNSGLEIRDAEVQLVAGNVQRRTSPVLRPQATAVRMMKSEAAPIMADAGGAPQRQSLGGFHLYTLPGRIDLEDKGRKQVTLLRSTALPVERELISEAHANPVAQLRGTPRPTHPAIRLTLTNDKTAGPGQPIPGGIARIYGHDAEGRTQFLGEDHLQDLPVGSTASISAGQAFDVAVTRHQTDYQREGLGRNTFEMAYRIDVSNGGDKAEKVSVIEAMSGDWSILDQSAEHSRVNNRARWTLDIPARGKAVITYRVRVKR